MLFTVFKSKKSNVYYEIINLVKRKNKYQDCCSYNLDNKINSCHKWALRLNFKQYYTASKSFLQSYIDERNFNQRQKSLIKYAWRIYFIFDIINLIALYICLRWSYRIH